MIGNQFDIYRFTGTNVLILQPYYAIRRITQHTCIWPQIYRTENLGEVAISHSLHLGQGSFNKFLQYIAGCKVRSHCIWIHEKRIYHLRMYALKKFFTKYHLTHIWRSLVGFKTVSQGNYIETSPGIEPKTLCSENNKSDALTTRQLRPPCKEQYFNSS